MIVDVLRSLRANDAIGGPNSLGLFRQFTQQPGSLVSSQKS